MCAQHDYQPKESTKMDGQRQTVYPRKNWSSMMLVNCSHPANKELTKELVNDEKHIKSIDKFKNVKVHTALLASSKYYENCRVYKKASFLNGFKVKVEWIQLCDLYDEELFQKADGRATILTCQRSHVAINEHRNQEGIYRSDRCCLRRGKYTAIDTA